MSQVVDFPGERLRRFVAVQMVQPGSWRAAVFTGWHLDPRIPPDEPVSTHYDALSRAEKGARKLGLPIVRDRFSVFRRGVRSAPAYD
jgi:endonuclease YncB( thermonuclease family)